MNNTLREVVLTKKQSPFCTIDSYLTNQLIETLSIELFSFWANSSFPGLTLLKLIVKSSSQLNDFCLGRRSGLHWLDPQLLFLHCVLPWWKNRIQNILCLCLCHVLIILFAETFSRLLTACRYLGTIYCLAKEKVTS